MKLRNQQGHTIDLIFPIAVFFVFAASSLAVLLLAANIYSKQTADADANYMSRISLYYVNEKKMHKARELLGNPHIMIKEAAYAVGYDDQFYFNKLFKRFFEVSPTEFRRRIQAQKQKENNK